jgi:hypothetical protein
MVLRWRMANARRAWIVSGAALLLCSSVWFWILSDDDEDHREALRRAHPGLTICFASDPLLEAKLWICGVNALVGAGVMLRGFRIRVPAP